MSSVSLVNPKAEVLRRKQAWQINVSAAQGMQDVLKTNLGGWLNAAGPPRAAGPRRAPTQRPMQGPGAR